MAAGAPQPTYGLPEVTAVGPSITDLAVTPSVSGAVEPEVAQVWVPEVVGALDPLMSDRSLPTTGFLGGLEGADDAVVGLIVWMCERRSGHQREGGQHREYERQQFPHGHPLGRSRWEIRRAGRVGSAFAQMLDHVSTLPVADLRPSRRSGSRRRPSITPGSTYTPARPRTERAGRHRSRWTCRSALRDQDDLDHYGASHGH